MACRSGLLALGMGIVLGLGSALALGGVAGEDEAAIVVRPVELVDPAPEDPFDLAPLFAPGPSRGTESQKAEADDVGEGEVPSDANASERAARTRTVELAGGDIVTVRLRDEPPLVLEDDDIAFVELAEAAIGDDGRAEAEAGAPLGERFAVYAVLADSGRAAWTPFAADHANEFLLVELAGRPVDLVRPLGWTRGLRIAVFPDELTRTHFVATLPFDSR